MTRLGPHFHSRARRHCLHFVFGAATAAVLGGVFPLNAGAATPDVMVVDIIPESLSGETNTNSEPNLAVNSANPPQIAASAWLPEPLGGKSIPIFVSMDGGTTWSCRSTVSINQLVCDTTLRFGGVSHMLYVASLEDPALYNLIICRNEQFAKTVMPRVGNRQGWIDQPYVATAMVNQEDRIFIGCNDWTASNGRTATIVRSIDGTAASPDFTPVPIEFATPPRDNSEIRPAISADNEKVYAVFNRVISINGHTRVADVVLVRDDGGGNSSPSFTALQDANGVAGVPVVKARKFLFETDDSPARLGRDRLGGDLAIAVDPRDANTLYLVWGELVENQPRLHIIRSENGGKNWSDILRTVRNAKNPGLAMNANGTLAFLYQQVVTDSNGTQTWVTKLERTKDDFTNVAPLTLAKFPVTEIDPNRGQPQLGDYLHLMSAGNDFYGIFSSMNVPDDSRFPCNVIFQRKADFAAKKLFDQDGNEVPPSIDPFFVKVTEPQN